MPTAFGQVAAPDTSATLLGRTAAAPIVLAPTGYTRLSHHTGERAAAVAAEQAGLPYTLSTYATTSITDVARAAPGGRNWFQVYLMKDRAVTRAHLDEARGQGYEALVLTIDTTVTGMKRKDKQNGFAIPPQLTARTMAGMARHPGWVADILTTEPLRFATFPEGSAHARWGMSNELREQEIRPADITWLREEWGGPVVVKGVQSVVDAVAAVDAGRTRSCCPTTVDASSTAPRFRSSCCPPSSRRSPVVRRCTSTQASAAAVTSSPQSRSAPPAVMVGRAYLYGLMVGGQRGVTHVLDLLIDEMRRAMGMLGTPTLADLTTAHARLRAW